MEFELPRILRDLVKADLWRSEDAHEDARIPRSVARRWDPHASGIHLRNPQPVAKNAGSSFFQNFGALEQISEHSCLEIADFGVGADSPIIVDIAQEGFPVSYLHWIVPGYKNGRTEWRRIGDLATFVREIFPDGTERPSFRRASSIEISKERYYWRYLYGADYLTILVQHVNGTGQQVEAQWVRPSGTMRNLDTTVKQLVRHALEQGWTPHVESQALCLSDMDQVITIDILKREPRRRGRT